MVLYPVDQTTKIETATAPTAATVTALNTVHVPPRRMPVLA
jgi:hypothetical protein